MIGLSFMVSSRPDSGLTRDIEYQGRDLSADVDDTSGFACRPCAGGASGHSQHGTCDEINRFLSMIFFCCVIELNRLTQYEPVLFIELFKKFNASVR